MPAKIYKTFQVDHPQFDCQDRILETLRLRLDADSRAILILSIPEAKQVGVWGHNEQLIYHNISRMITVFRPDAIVLTALAEPHWEGNHFWIYNSIIKPTNIPCYLFGAYVYEHATYFSFPVLFSNESLLKYDDLDLTPQPSDKFFLNLNRVPRVHRVALCERLESIGLIDHGYVSLGRRINPLTIPENSLILNNGNSPDTQPFPVPLDANSLGDLTIWNQTVINVVSETDWLVNERFGNVYVSEKTIKPIIGLRPFLLNGSYDNLLHLKDIGFDVFEDAFGFNIDNFKTMSTAHDTIIDILNKFKQLTPESRLDWYTSLLPRLRANRDRYYQYVLEQQQILDTYKLP
jgi:hypothetical protein